MPSKKKVTRLKGQTQLSFASQRLEQEGQESATPVEKDDAITTQAKSKEGKFFKPRLKKYSWLVYEKNGNYSCICTAESVQRLGNLTEWASKPSAEILKKKHTHLTSWFPWTQDSPPRPWDKKVIQGSSKKRWNKQNLQPYWCFSSALMAIYGDQPACKIQIATGTSSWFAAWRHS